MQCATCGKEIEPEFIDAHARKEHFEK